VIRDRKAALLKNDTVNIIKDEMVETTADTIDTHDTKHYSDDEIE